MALVNLKGVDNTNFTSSINPFPVTSSSTIPGGVTQPNITCFTATMPTSSTTVTLTAASYSITLVNNSADVMYVNYTNGTATTSSFAIQSGAAFTYIGAAIQQFKILGVDGTGKYSCEAN